MAEEFAAILIMVLIIISLIVAWISLTRRPEGTMHEAPFEQYLSENMWPMIAENQAQAPRQAVRQQPSVSQAKTPRESFQAKKAVPVQQRVTHPAGTEGRASRPEATSNLTSAERQPTTGGEAKQAVKEEASRKTDAEEAETPIDIESLESMLVETKKLFAILLEEYERLKELID